MIRGAVVDGRIGTLTAPQMARIPSEVIRKIVLDPPESSSPYGLRIRSAVIEGTVDLDFLKSAPPLALQDCRIEGDLRVVAGQLNQLILNGSAVRNLILDGTTILNGLFATGLTCVDKFSALNAIIHKQLILRKAQLLGGATLAGSEIKGLLDATECLVDKGLNLSRAQIAMQVHLVKAQITAREIPAVNMNGAKIDGGVTANEARIFGAWRAMDATIGNGLRLRKALIANPHNKALSLDRSTLPGGADLRGVFLRGSLSAPGTIVGAQFNLSQAKIRHDREGAICASFESASLQVLILRPIRTSGPVNLGNAKLDVLSTDGRVQLTRGSSGWSFNALQGPLRDSASNAIDWLEEASGRGFSPHPWTAFADYYDRSGQPTEARKMRVAAANQVTSRTRGTTWLARMLFRGLAGYGYRPLRAVWSLLTVIGIVWAVSIGAGPSSFVPTAPAVASAGASAQCPGRITAASPKSCINPAYEEFDPIWYAVATVSPAGSLGNPAWTPRPFGVKLVATAAKTSGWLLAGLLLAGVTGLLRKR